MQADLTFRALLLIVDDYGRTDGRLPILKAALYPMREVALEDLALWLDELASCDGSGLDGRSGPVIRYEVQGKPYVQLRAWEKHVSKQRRAGSSRYPPPPSPEIPGNPRRSNTSPTPTPNTNTNTNTREDSTRNDGETGSSDGPGEPISQGLPESQPPGDLDAEPPLPQPAPPKRRARQPETPAPERLTPRERKLLVIWAQKNHPWAEGQLGELEQACLAWHRREDKWRRSWYGAVQSWITKQKAINRERGQETPRPRRYVESTPEETAAYERLKAKQEKHLAERKRANPPPPGPITEAQWMAVAKGREPDEEIEV